MGPRLSIGLGCVRDQPLQLRQGSPGRSPLVGAVSPELLAHERVLVRGPWVERQQFSPVQIMLPSQLGTCRAAYCSRDLQQRDFPSLQVG